MNTCRHVHVVLLSGCLLGTGCDHVYAAEAPTVGLSGDWLAPIPEGATRELTVWRSGDTTLAFEVGYATADGTAWARAEGTAQAGKDYVPLNGTLSFAAGEESKSVRLETLDNGQVGVAVRYLTFYLTNTTGRVEVSSSGWGLSIEDNEMPANLDLAFNPPPFIAGATYAIQPDGKIVGLRQGWRCLTRFNADGTGDVTFKPPLFSFGNLDAQGLDGVAVATDGKILCSGDFDHVGTLPRVRLARFLPDGSLDTGFVPPTGYGTNVWHVRLLGVQRDRKPLLAVAYGTEPRRARLFRLAESGVVDQAFQVPTFDGENWSMAVAQDTDGRMLVAGEFTTVNGQPRNRPLVRLMPDGLVDNSFLARFSGERILVEPGLGIVVSGVADGCWTVRRLMPDGSSDEIFERNFESAFPRAECGGSSYYLAAYGTNQLLVTWADWKLGEWRMALLNANGTLARALPAFRPDHIGDSNWFVPGPQLHQGALLVAGRLSGINGVGRSMARILLDEIPANAIALTHTDLFVCDRSCSPHPYESFDEEGGRATIKIRRLGSSLTPVTVAYTTRDGAAKAGDDYVATQGTIAFAPYEVENTIHLPLIADGVAEPDEHFQLVLTSAAPPETALNPPYTVILAGGGPLLQINTDNLMTGGTAQLGLRAPSLSWPDSWTVQRSEDLVHWTRLNRDSSYSDSEGFGWSVFTDTRADRSDVGFYRARRAQ